VLRGSIRGVVGYVRWAYYDAARIDGYTITREGSRWTVTGRVVFSDSFKMTRRPLIFVAPHKHGEWRWPMQEFELRDGVVTAQLGAPEEVSHGVQSVRSA
jgi:hypothetical protein